MIRSSIEEYEVKAKHLISIKTKKHKSLGVLNLVFIKLFFEKSKTLSIEDVAKIFADN